MGLFKNLNKIVLVIEYNGKRYFGFQWQKELPTVQDELEKAIYRLTGERRRVLAASRTDTGVHARAQVVSFRTESGLPLRTFVDGLNHYLPDDIAVLKSFSVSERFNVMKEAIAREYEYHILNRPCRSPLLNDHSFWVRGELDTAAMNQASQLIVGEHDFASFVSSWNGKVNTVKRVSQAEFCREGELIKFRISANAFLTHQVRNTVGLLIRIGLKQSNIEEFKRIMDARKCGLAGPAAPPYGLYLTKVIYADDSELNYENLCT